MERLLKKKIFGEDKDSFLIFHLKKLDVDSIYKLKKLCELNPQKCSKIRPELCKKMFILNGYSKIPKDPCKMYINIVDAIKISHSYKKLVDISIKPSEDLFNIISLFGNKYTKDFFISCNYKLPEILIKSTKIIEDTPTIKIKSTIKRNSSKKK